MLFRRKTDFPFSPGIHVRPEFLHDCVSILIRMDRIGGFFQQTSRYFMGVRSVFERKTRIK